MIQVARITQGKLSNNEVAEGKTRRQKLNAHVMQDKQVWHKQQASCSSFSLSDGWNRLALSQVQA